MVSLELPGMALPRGHSLRGIPTFRLRTLGALGGAAS
jgi:hypothetical protein